MQILFTGRFERAYDKLTGTEKRNVRKSVSLLGDNAKHPGLRVKKMQGRLNIWEARCSLSLRLTFEMAGDTIIIRNVGAHDEVLKNP